MSVAREYGDCANSINEPGTYNQETFDPSVLYRPAEKREEHAHLLVSNRIGLPGTRPAHATNATQEAQPSHQEPVGSGGRRTTALTGAFCAPRPTVSGLTNGRVFLAGINISNFGLNISYRESLVFSDASGVAEGD